MLGALLTMPRSHSPCWIAVVCAIFLHPATLCVVIRRSSASPPSLYSQLDAMSFLNSGIINSSSHYVYVSRSVMYGETENVSTSQTWWGQSDEFPILYENDGVDGNDRQCELLERWHGGELSGRKLKSKVMRSDEVTAEKDCIRWCCDTAACKAWSLRRSSPASFNCHLQPNIGRRTAAQSDDRVVSGSISARRDGLGVHPPSGLRSAVPLGGVAAGGVELRGDGSFHEWTMVNQSPGGAAKYGVFDQAIMGLRTRLLTSNTTHACTVRTSPPAGLPGVAAIRYRGSYPTARLDLLDPTLPITSSVFGYSALRVGDLNRSATPALVLSVNLLNPTSEPVEVSFLFNLPFGIEVDQCRLGAASYRNFSSTDALLCVAACANETGCQSWNFLYSQCILNFDVPLNRWCAGSMAGVKGEWRWSLNHQSGATSSSAQFAAPLQHVRPNNVSDPSTGDLSMWPAVSSGDGSELPFTFSVGLADSLTEMWANFADNGRLDFRTPSGAAIATHGAVCISVVLEPGQRATASVVLSWYFPSRDHVGVLIGNFYQHLFTSSVDAAQSILDEDGSGLAVVATDILTLHSIYHGSSLPTYLTDSLINSFSHVRSAFWIADGRWRQWEAYDCVDVDSVHNDYQRHIPYLLYFPETEKNKLRQHAANQQADGMINEVLIRGCSGYTFNWTQYGGRVMSDVSTLFIVEVFEIWAWTNDTAFVEELYPAVRKAAKWQIGISLLGLPPHLLNTYDLIELDAYQYATFNAVLHLLAMQATMKLAAHMTDWTLYDLANTSFHNGSALIESLLWNRTAHYYSSWYDPLTPGNGVVFADALYGQVVAYTLGLGAMLPVDHMEAHLLAEEANNDTPYGLIAQTGREDLGNSQDNSIWMGASQDWSALALRLDAFNNSHAFSQGQKAMDNWRTRLNDQWNVWGLVGGMGLGMDGLHWATSHYGFHMVLWHSPFAVSGQQYFAPDGMLSFVPRVQAPFVLPVLIPNAMGTLRADVVGADDRVEGTLVQYTLTMKVGALTLTSLIVNGCSADAESLTAAQGQTITWKSASDCTTRRTRGRKEDAVRE